LNDRTSNEPTHEVRIERERCTGHARCHAVAPELFPIDELGFVEIDSRPLLDADLVPATAASDVCPELAITVARLT
jgi:ferredoxin